MDNRIWKLQGNAGSVVSSSDEEVDLNEKIYPIGYYIDDREEMIEQVFSCIKSDKLDKILPPFLKNVPLEELKADCLIHLLGMSRKRILSIIQGKDLHSSTDTDSDSILEKTEKAIKKSDSLQKNENGTIDPTARLNIGAPDGIECELDILVSEKDVKDLINSDKPPVTVRSKANSVNPPNSGIKEESSSKENHKSKNENEEKKKKKVIDAKDKVSAGAVGGGEVKTDEKPKKYDSKSGTVSKNVTNNKQSKQSAATGVKNVMNADTSKQSVAANNTTGDSGPRKKRKVDVNKKKNSGVKKELAVPPAVVNPDESGAVAVVAVTEQEERSKKKEEKGDKVTEDDDKGNLLEILELEIKAEAIRALLQNHDDADLDVKAELLGLSDFVMKSPEQNINKVRKKRNSDEKLKRKLQNKRKKKNKDKKKKSKRKIIQQPENSDLVKNSAWQDISSASSIAEDTPDDLMANDDNCSNGKNGRTKKLARRSMNEDAARHHGESWPERWLESKNVKDVVATSKICANIRKRMKQARMNKQNPSADNLTAISANDLNLDITGSVGEYYRLQGNEPSSSSSATSIATNVN